MNNSDIQYAIEHGIIDLAQVAKETEMAKRKELLSKHQFDIWQGNNGKWYTYITIDGKRTQRKRNTREEIETLVCKYIAEQIENPTVKEVFDDWNDWKLSMGKVSESTYLRYKSDFQKFYGEFGKKRIRNLLPDDFRDFLENQIPRFHLTAKRFSNLKTITRGFLRHARRKKYIDWNYEYMLSDVDVSDRDFQKTFHEDYEEVYDDSEMEKIVAYLMENQDQKNLGLLLLFVTGIRVGELSALKPENIGDDCIYIRMTETRLVGENDHVVIGVKDFPKTEAGWRTVAVPTQWQWLLKKLKAMNPWGEWVFARIDSKPYGKRIDNTAFEKRLQKVNNTLGIYHKSPHKIRKTYCSILLDASIDQNLIIQQMGHTSIAVSERHYHRNRKTMNDKIRILDDLDPLNLDFLETKRNQGKSQKMLNFQRISASGN